MTANKSMTRLILLPLMLMHFLANAVLGTPIVHGNFASNVTRLEGGDTFFVTGGDCGVTRCNEVSAGTALSNRPPGSGPPCGCRCRPDLPMFREDLLQCVNDITECPLAEFGKGETASKVPYVFIPLNGQIIYPSKEINFEDSENAICAVSQAQFLTKTGWSSLRNDADSDVPFSLFRDEGKTFLQWRGTENTRNRTTGRILLARLACRSRKRLFNPCVSFRVPGTAPDIHEVTEVWFSHGELSAEKEKDEEEGVSGISKAAGVIIVLSAIFVVVLYGTLLFLHIRNKSRQPSIVGSENTAFKEDILPNTKTNPLMSIESFLKETQGSSFEVFGAKTDSMSTSSNISEKTISEPEPELKSEHNFNESMCSLITNATVHKEKLNREEMSGCVEKIPELHISIVESSGSLHQLIDECELSSAGSHFSSNGSQRKKLYFNPAFFELDNLKSPPPAAVEFLIKIREVINIAKNKMLSKRFVPVLPSIPEEEYLKQRYFDFPYESLSKNHSIISLKRENSRQKRRCAGCPGCTEMKFRKTYMKTLSEKEFCKSCISSEFKQDIVKKWLEDVPTTTSNKADTLKQYHKSVAKVQGTPSPVNPNQLNDLLKSQDKVSINVTNDFIKNDDEKIGTKISKLKDEDLIPKELKEKMNAVIDELSRFRKVEPIQPRASSPITEVVTPFIPKSVIAVTPKLVIPTPPKYAKRAKPKVINFEMDKKQVNLKQREFQHFEVDSLEKITAKRRSSLSNIDYIGMKAIENERTHKRRSSIIAMDELEPMKKIHEMNSRLSRSFQEISAASLAWNDEIQRFRNEKYIMSKPNLVSEIYISDSSPPSIDCDKSNKSKLKINYVEPLTKPGQLVIEVEGPKSSEKNFDYEDFDPDTLDRKPGKLKVHKDINITPPISPNKTIDKLFLKARKELAEKNSVNMDLGCKEENNLSSKVKVGSLLEIFEAKNKQTPHSPNKTYVTIGEDDYKPALPPKKKAQFSHKDYGIINQNESSKSYDNLVKYRITRSEPYCSFQDERRFPTNLDNEKKYTSFGSMTLDSNGNDYYSLETAYENHNNEIDYKYFKSAKTISENDLVNKMMKSQRNESANLKRIGRRSNRYRHRRMEQNKIHKTEDSGYLSSDSNESRNRNKFVLQIREKDDSVRETVSDTDDLDSMGDARSESGGESIETNSVFFGSYRRLALLNRNGLNSLDRLDDSGFQGDMSKASDESDYKNGRTMSDYNRTNMEHF